MSPPRIGIWFIGARGGVAATATLGLVALGKELAGTVGLVSELPQFAGLDLADWDSFVVGGHEIREGSLVDSLRAAGDGQPRAGRQADRRLPGRIGRHRRPHSPRHARQLRPDDRRPGRPGDARLRPRAGPRRHPAAAERSPRLPAANRGRPRDRRQSWPRPSRRPTISTLPAALGRLVAGDRRQGLQLAAGQFAVRHRRARPGPAVHQLHAVARRDAAGHRRIGRAARHVPRRPGRQDRRNAAQKRAGTRCSPPATWR